MKSHLRRIAIGTVAGSLALALVAMASPPAFAHGGGGGGGHGGGGGGHAGGGYGGGHYGGGGMHYGGGGYGGGYGGYGRGGYGGYNRGGYGGNYGYGGVGFFPFLGLGGFGGGYGYGGYGNYGGYGGGYGNYGGYGNGYGNYGGYGGGNGYGNAYGSYPANNYYYPNAAATAPVTYSSAYQPAATQPVITPPGFPVEGLGIYEESVNDGVVRGVRITRVDAGSAAERAGLRAGDVIVQSNGYLVQDAGNLRWVISHSANGTLSLVVRSVGEAAGHPVTVPLG